MKRVALLESTLSKVDGERCLTRRALLVSMVIGIVGRPMASIAQPSGQARIGALYIGIADAASFMAGLRQGMRDLGYIEGQNVSYEFRSAEGKLERLPDLAAELVRLKVDAIVALYVPCALAAKNATREIPIVILAGDPVETGIVTSLASPGGNITGISLMAAKANGKSVELFRDMLPSLRRVAVLADATNPVYAKAMLEEVRLAGGPTGVEIHPVLMIGGAAELQGAFATIAKERADALVVQGSLSIKPVADLAIAHRLPAASTTRSFADIGGLMSFGADGPTVFRHAAKFVHAVLQGRPPRELPIEQPTRYELALNLRTARAIGLRIANAFLLRADAVVE